MQIWRRMPIPTRWGDESPVKSRRKVVWKDQLPCWRSLFNWVVCLMILVRENTVYRQVENWDQISKGTWHHIKIRGKKGSIARSCSKVRTSWAQSVRPKFWGTKHKTKPCNKKDCPRGVAWDLAKSVYKLQKLRIKLRFTLLLRPGQRRRPLQKL